VNLRRSALRITLTGAAAAPNLTPEMSEGEAHLNTGGAEPIDRARPSPAFKSSKKALKAKGPPGPSMFVRA